MKKQYWIAILVILVLALGYRGRHKISTLLGRTPTAPAVTQTETSAPSPSSSAVAGLIMTKTDSTKGSYLSDSRGMTLYVFDKDTKGVSNCNGSCATLWPPFAVGSTPPSTLPTNVTTLKRADGSMQYAYNGLPLYYYQKDSKPDDITGDGVGGIWHLVKP